MKMQLHKYLLIVLLAMTTIIIPVPLDVKRNARPATTSEITDNSLHQKIWIAVTLVGVITGTYAYIQREKIKTLFDTTEKLVEPSDTITASQEQYEDFSQEEELYKEKLASLLPGCASAAQAESTMLTQAIAQKNIKFMRYLLQEKEVSPNVPNKAGVRPLGCVAMLLEKCTQEEKQKTYEEIMMLLLEYGADPKKRCTNNTQDSPNIRSYCSKRIKQKISPSLKEALGVHFDE